MSVRARRALVSTSDRTALPQFVLGLDDLGIQIISTGGTAAFIREAGIDVTEVADITGFPEIMDGRVKTLHPCIHGGLLAVRSNAEHMATIAEHGIEPIDIVCVNLYPFEETVAKPDCTLEEAIEKIDIGGPSMLRSAAKNCESIYVVSSPAQYEETLRRLRADNCLIDPDYGRSLAAEVYRLTSRYDTAVSSYLASRFG
jgi:phosphoribosylaminoimidazolecarboxamide formyltransferase/IMP cyclohydrolase